MSSANTYLGFDYGSHRVGLAVGDGVTRSARALTAATSQDWRTFDRVVADWRPAALIVGLPLDEHGADQPMTLAARKFAEQLRVRYRLPVHECDERYSSRAADDVLRNARASGQMMRRVRKGDRDSEAARVILEQWLLSL